MQAKNENILSSSLKRKSVLVFSQLEWFQPIYNFKQEEKTTNIIVLASSLTRTRLGRVPYSTRAFRTRIRCFVTTYRVFWLNPLSFLDEKNYVVIGAASWIILKEWASYLSHEMLRGFVAGALCNFTDKKRAILVASLTCAMDLLHPCPWWPLSAGIQISDNSTFPTLTKSFWWSLTTYLWEHFL